MKSLHKLRRKLSDKSRALELLKNKYVSLLVENDKLKEELKESAMSKNFKIPFIKETKHELFCLEHQVASMSEKDVVEAPTNFSSRFMPNVKFKVIGNSVAFSSLKFPMMCNYIRTAFDGSIVEMCDYQGRFDDDWSEVKEVSIYEAIPELVPDGMVYDKESDTFQIVLEKGKPVEFAGVDFHVSHSSLMKFAGELSRATPFSITTCLSVIEDYGEQNARAVLGLMASGIDVSVLKLKKS